jgi:heme-degrading monooxygenase HmoA
MKHISIINTILVPEGMESQAELVRSEYINYFAKQEGFISSVFYKSTKRESDNAIKYVNIVVWESQLYYEQVVNKGFQNKDGENSDGMRVLGKGFPEPIVVSPGIYQVVEKNVS